MNSFGFAIGRFTISDFIAWLLFYMKIAGLKSIISC
jgi:hypothetical protein